MRERNPTPCFAPMKSSSPPAATIASRHLRQGWWALFAFLALGVMLETLHGFKIGWYLSADVEMRRLMFTLAHSHGTLLALLNIATGLTMRSVPEFNPGNAPSSAIRWGSLILPLGFLLGGAIIHDGDPGVAVLLVPVGAILLLYGVGSSARSLSQTLKN